MQKGLKGLVKLSGLAEMADSYIKYDEYDKFDEIAKKIDQKFKNVEKFKKHGNIAKQLEEAANTVSRKINSHSQKSSEHERHIEGYNQAIRKLEEKKESLEETARKIESKLEEDLNDATREKIEEMLENVNDSIESIQEQISELDDKIDELQEEYENFVDEDIINEIANLPGLSLGNGASDIRGDSKIDVEVFREFAQKYSDISTAEREKRRNYKSQGRYHVNFCAGATIDSFCCFTKDSERPENLINDDPHLKTRWRADKKHIVTESTAPHWVVIDLKEITPFNYVFIRKASAGNASRDRGNKSIDMSAWRIEVSDDKENWKEFNRETEDHSSIYEYKFNTVRGRYVRLLIDAAEANPSNKLAPVRLYEFKLKMLDEADTAPMK